MLCVRCGAANAETAPFCGDCGASLRKQLDTPMAMDTSNQPFVLNAEEMATYPIDEMPTAQVPSMPGPSGYAPVSQIPYGQEFPLELGQTLAPSAQLDGDVTAAAPFPQLAFTPQPPTPADSQPVSAAQSSSPDIANYPTRTSVPVAPASNPALAYSAGQDTNSPASSLAGAAPSAQFARPGMFTLPSRPQKGIPASQPGLNTPSGIAAPANMGAPPSQPGVGMRAQSADGPGQQGWRSDGNNPTPSAPERLGNVYPGAPNRVAEHGPVSQGGATSSAGQLPAEEVNKFARPLPRWAALGGPVVAVLLLIGLVFVNPDWATGAMIAGLIAIILAFLLAIAAGVRVALGLLKQTNPRRRSQMISTALLIVLLLLLSGVGISQQKTLHMVQGRYLESQQSWSVAISEYQAAGERSSAAVDVARVYNEWGEAQNKQQQYAGAVTSFSIVIQNYQQETSEFSRAKTDIVVAYLGWADQASQQQDYTGATAHYDALLSLVFCDTASNCMLPAQSKDATAYYHLAEQQLTQQRYAQAVAAYQTLQTRFSQAPEISQIHAHYAQALWGNGQQLLSTSCPDALSTYRLLTRLFADTSEGQQAATALAKPVQVKGHFTQSVPGAPYHPTVFLVQGLVVGIQQYQFPPLLAHAPTATIQSDGSFTFASVPQGTYELVWSSDNTLHFYYAYSGQHVLYVAHLGQLCAFDYGPVNQAIPTK